VLAYFWFAKWKKMNFQAKKIETISSLRPNYFAAVFFWQVMLWIQLSIHKFSGDVPEITFKIFQ